MDIFHQYATDESLENEGTWFELGQGAKLLIAREGNKAYAKMLSKLYQRDTLLLEGGGDVAEARSQEIMVEVIANTVLLGWEGIKFKGEPMAYSVENAKKLLTIKDFRRQVVTFSSGIDAYLMREEKEQGEA